MYSFLNCFKDINTVKVCFQSFCTVGAWTKSWRSQLVEVLFMTPEIHQLAYAFTFTLFIPISIFRLAKNTE